MALDMTLNFKELGAVTTPRAAKPLPVPKELAESMGRDEVDFMLDKWDAAESKETQEQETSKVTRDWSTKIDSTRPATSKRCNATSTTTQRLSRPRGVGKNR